ncbi:Serine aminopeptidase, S33 [Lentzea xinjiangensis]|uniref:Serine aminopeptidase, S33 n=1 Tax=Lentzea xinjiangensis TaxID=402600 RepID=A0A1H9JPM1_9PSEU|nr:alpha/beta fold hydrolase [Lentzea xinjiangensis]SEQ88728.1 Serine aminopeptidase, S33 [Lentzea xinjiangensis]
MLTVILAAIPALTAPATASSAPAPGASRPVLISSTPHPEPAWFNADARLLVHTMPTVTGGRTTATTLLFTPRGKAPRGGWPVVAWAHGTTTPGNKDCAPSLTPDDLDGGLTRDGFASDYAWELGHLVNAGYAVVAPDFEGLGPRATTPLPYYSADSLARSLITGVQAARQAERTLSNSYVAVGHSDGGHAVLGVEAHAGEAPELRFAGTAALAPFTSIPKQVAAFERDAQTSPDPVTAANGRVNAQFNVALMAVGLAARQPFDPTTIMGPHLAEVLPRFAAQCSVGANAVIRQAVEAKPGSFAGYHPDWAANEAMRNFLAISDPGADPRFALRKPTFIAQGTNDAFVFEEVVTPFVATARQNGSPIDYRIYPGADHFSLIKASGEDLLDFLARRLPR